MILADGVEPEDGMDGLFEACYDELREHAARRMRHERSGHTLQPTAIVHEVFLKLRKSGRLDHYSRGHFLIIASRAMQQVLIDYGRARSAKKRPTAGKQVLIDGLADQLGLDVCDGVALTRALERLANFPKTGERKVSLVRLVCFGGLEIQEAADHLGLSRRQATRDWRYALTWLRRELT